MSKGVTFDGLFFLNFVSKILIKIVKIEKKEEFLKILKFKKC